MAAQTREDKRCAYCGSRNISAGRREGLKLAMSKLASVWSSPDKPEIVVRPKSEVACADCGAAYTVQTIGNEETRRLLPGVAVKGTALANFPRIFPGRTLDDLWDSVTASVLPEEGGTLHIFFALDGKRAYLACGMSHGRFAAVTVEVVAG